MGNLTEFVPKDSETVQRIYAAYKARGDAEPKRGYLGASIVGHECDRYLWYVFRGAVRENMPGRVYRLLDTGHREEARLVADLRAIGCEVVDVDEATGKQFKMKAIGDHVAGHMDARVLGVPEAPKTWHVAEFKTASAKNFAKIAREGVQAAKPQHYAQMQVYMGACGLDRALYLVRNKDTDELYSERVRFDRATYEALMARARRVIEATQPLERVASRPDDFRCKFCPAHALCWGSDETAPAVPIPAQTCRTCCHATPDTTRPGATWRCERYRTEIDTAVGAECPTHLLLPGLVSFAEPVDSDGDSIEFRSNDNTRWTHGQQPGQWTTKQLMTTRGPRDALTRHDDPLLDALPAPLPDAYPWADSELLWDGPAHDLADHVEKLIGPLEVLNHPARTISDETVNGAEYRTSAGDYYVVRYAEEDHAAIWRGKS